MGRHHMIWSTARRVFNCSSLVRQQCTGVYSSCHPSCYLAYRPKHCRQYTTETKVENPLMDHLKARLKAGGPMPVAEYMKEVLTNSYSGYYMHKDVFGAAGDFITSPEISQMFGEMLGIWVVNEVMNNYKDQKIQLVELGPGRGTLADDMLRTFCHFPELKDKISLHLVEVSPTLGQIQEAKLTGKEVSEVGEDSDSEYAGAYRTATSKYGIDVSWYRNLVDVPEGLSCFIAHEFLDALPIYKFQKTESGWREVMVDQDPSNPTGLSFVLAPTETAASIALLPKEFLDVKDHIEVNPGAGITLQYICKQIKTHGGMALLADYGHSGEKSDTFRAFKNHKLHDPLVDPGTADLTADVDFAYLKSFTDDEVSVFGPITQEKFLTNMGIGVRLQSLLQTTKQENWASLISGFRMLLMPEQMGERFKFLAVLGKTEELYKPGGFVDINIENDQEPSS